MSELRGTWTRFRTAQPCGGCDERIAPGEPVYLTQHQRTRCTACVRRLWNEDPPADLRSLDPTAPVAAERPCDQASGFARFTRDAVVASTPALDVRQRQSGEGIGRE